VFEESSSYRAVNTFRLGYKNKPLHAVLEYNIYLVICVLWDEITGDWRKLHNEELNYLYSLPNIVRVVKSRRMRWAGHVARMGED